MDVFNIGGLELLFLVGIAIIIVGPARAAEIAGEIGRIVARARRTINSLTEDLRTQAREETEPLRSARESLRDVEAELRRPLDIPDARPNTGRADPSADASTDETAESPDTPQTVEPPDPDSPPEDRQ